MSPEPNLSTESVQRGVEHPAIIDMIMYDQEQDEAVLIMIEPRPWDGGEEQLFQLQEKFNVYLSFALDGEMVEAYPALAGKRLRVQLEATYMPEGEALKLLKQVHDQIAFQGIKLEVRVKQPTGGGCGTGCGCAN